VPLRPASGGGAFGFRADVAVADAALVARGATLGQTFAAAWEAANHVLLAAPERIEPRSRRRLELTAESLPMLLFDWLSELVYWKDAHALVLVPQSVAVEPVAAGHRLTATLAGETLDPARHEPRVDIKAVTLYRLRVQAQGSEWVAEAVVDI